MYILGSATRVIGDIGEMFQLLASFDIAAVHEPTRGWNYVAPAAKAFPESNTGVLVCDKSSRVEAFFRRWELLYGELREVRA